MSVLSISIISHSRSPGWDHGAAGFIR